MSTLIAYSLLMDTKKPMLLQSGFKRMMTFLVTQEPEGSPIAVTKRGRSFVCTYNALESLPAALNDIVATTIPRIASDGFLHVPYVIHSEHEQYGKKALRLMSTYRSNRVKHVDDPMQQMVLGGAFDTSPHIFIVEDGEFHAFK